MKKRNFIIFVILFVPIFLSFLKLSTAQYSTNININTVGLNINVNLYGTSEIYDKYYLETGEWGNYSERNSVSMIVDVEPGDIIIANSFQATPDNRGNENGVRLTYLLDNTIKYSLSPIDVYSEYTANGHLKVPKNVNKANIVWWDDSEENYLYIIKKSDSNNLYNVNEIENKYYDGGGNYVSRADVVSMIVDVEPGDLIDANSFRAVPLNNCPENTDGIRVTYLLDGVIVSTIAPIKVYEEWSKYGNIKVPKGVNQACIAWWTKSDENYLYITKDDDEVNEDGNLYNERLVEKMYYNSEGNWTSSNSIVSMMVNVEPGYTISANSFKNSPDNGGTRNGIVITYLYENTIVKTIEPIDVYFEYSVFGYVTVPEGVDEVNVAWWSENDENYLYITEGTDGIITNNLYDSSAIDSKYYDQNGNYVSLNNVVSMIVDIEPGSAFVANSFKSSTQNNGSGNGIRVTYLLDGVIVSTLSPSEVYTLCDENGCLIVPEGVNQVNVAWWSDSTDNYLYINSAQSE